MPRTLVAIVLVLTIVAAGVFAGGSTEPSGDEGAPAPFAERVGAMSWDDIVAEASGEEVFFYMWGGSDAINEFVQGYMGERLAEEYGITLNMVPVTDAGVFVNKVTGEKQAGRTEDGSVDLMWINGENFRTMKENDLLFGPYADMLPNMAYVDETNPVVELDFGFPVEGYESPYGGAQFVVV